MRNSFAFYRSFMDAIEEIPDQIQKAKAYKVIIEYGLNGVEPDPEQDIVIKVLFKQAKPQIDTCNKRYDTCVSNGKKGGNPNFVKGKSNPYYKTKDNQEDNQRDNQEDNQTHNLNYNYNDNDNYKYNERVNSLCYFLSRAYKQFKINVDKSELEGIDIERLKEKLKQSTYLQTTNMRFVLDHYQDILNGKYDDFSKRPKQEQNYSNRDYTGEDLNTLFDNLEEIEL